MDALRVPRQTLLEESPDFHLGFDAAFAKLLLPEFSYRLTKLPEAICFTREFSFLLF